MSTDDLHVSMLIGRLHKKIQTLRRGEGDFRSLSPPPGYAPLTTDDYNAIFLDLIFIYSSNLHLIEAIERLDRNYYHIYNSKIT